MNFDYKLTPNKKNKEYCSDFEIDYNFTPKVSIITPFYNSGEYILDTATTVFNQTFPWFEWIIIDDGSKDKKSLKVLSELENKDKRIKVFHKENTGLANTRDFGCKVANKNTKYYVFLDDDDFIENNYIECAYYALESEPEGAFAYTNCVGFGEQEYLWDKKFDIKTQMKDNLLVATAMVRKDVYESVGGYGLKEKGVNEDWIFWTKLFSQSYKPLKMNYYGFWYRRKKQGELKKSFNNFEKTKSYLENFGKDIDYSLEAIEYPKDNYSWDDVNNKNFKFKQPGIMDYKKTNILMIMPQIVMGGADKFNIDFLKGIDKEKYYVTAVFTNISENNWLQEINKYVDTYYILPSFLERKNWNTFIEYLMTKNNTKLVLNTNSTYGYICLPYIKNKFPHVKIMDYIHMEEWYHRNGGYSRDSSAVSSVIDLTLTCNKNSEMILKKYFKRKNDKIDTCYIGIDEEKFKNNLNKNEMKEKYNVPKNKKIITYIARISYQKRPFLLVEIIKETVKLRKDVLFLICGDGELLDELKHKIKKNNLSYYVKFLGSIKETKEIYAISDITLNCSIKEGLALTTYESLSMDVPVISSNVGGQKEIIDDTVGYLIETDQNEEDIYDFNYSKSEIKKYVININKILNNLDKYKNVCRNKILNGFTIKQMNIKMNNYIDELINDKNETNSFKNEDVAKELINQYLLTTQQEYNWHVYQYNKKYGIDNSKQEIKKTLRVKIIELTVKLHIYEESKIIASIIKKVLEIIYLLFKFPLTIVNRIKNLIEKILI